MNYVKGDSLSFECEIELDLTGYKIRAELYDNKGVSIQKATLNSGGADDQILVTDATNGLFTIYVDAGETTNIKSEAWLEIEVESSTGIITTVFQQYLDFSKEKITWSVPT